MRYYNKPKPLGDILDEWVRKSGLKKKLDQSTIIETWASIAGPPVNSVTERVWLRHKKLFVRITDASWRHSLHLDRVLWCQKLNDNLEGDVPKVKEILFR